MKKLHRGLTSGPQVKVIYQGLELEFDEDLFLSYMVSDELRGYLFGALSMHNQQQAEEYKK